MSKSNQRKIPITINQPTETKYFKQTCLACFIAVRSVPRALEAIPRYADELATDVSEAWEESGKR